MSSRTLFSRRDPWWEADGPAARNARRRRRILGSAAFAAALVALTGSAFAWSIQLGVAAAVGIHASLPLG